jgi:hypothetical protein
MNEFAATSKRLHAAPRLESVGAGHMNCEPQFKIQSCIVTSDAMKADRRSVYAQMQL